MGINFPDPDNRVCNLIQAYENEKLSYNEFSKSFFEAVDEEAAILPVSHYGIKFFISKSINQELISPLLAIVKFDQIGINNESN